MDYMFLLQSLMMTNPTGAVALAKMAVKQVRGSGTLSPPLSTSLTVP